MADADELTTKAMSTEESRRIIADSPRHVLATLCVTVTTSYGTLYYAFAVLGPTISGREGWSLAWLTAGFSLASLISGLIAIPVGRIIQRRGPRGVMVAGAVLGPVALLGLAISPSVPLFLVAMAMTGVAAAGLFYPPAFAAITHWYGEHRLQALTNLTLVAGFASTIFAPLVTQLASMVGWRWAYVVLAVLLLATAFPLHLRALDHPWHHAAQVPHQFGRTAEDCAILRSRRFALVATAGALVTLSFYGSVIGLVPLLEERGLSDHASAWVLGIGGAGQVLGRLFYPRMARHLGVRPRAVVVILLIAVPTGLLAVVDGPVTVLLTISVGAGMGRGLFTLVGATLVTEIWGPQRYAALNGVLSAPLGVATAVGPFAAAGIAAIAGSYAATFAVLAALALLGAITMAAGLHNPPRGTGAAGRGTHCDSPGLLGTDRR